MCNGLDCTLYGMEITSNKKLAMVTVQSTYIDIRWEEICMSIEMSIYRNNGEVRNKEYSAMCFLYSAEIDQ